MALAIHLHNKQKRKASAMGVFLNVETQRKFLKLTTAAGLEKELDYAAHKYYDLLVENRKLKQELEECEYWCGKAAMYELKYDRAHNTINVHLQYWKESDEQKDAQIEELKEENQRLKEDLARKNL